MIPKIFKSPLTDQYYICTKYDKLEDSILSLTDHNHKFKIPKEIIEQIAMSHFLKTELEGFEKGYSRIITTPEGIDFSITVKRIGKVK